MNVEPGSGTAITGLLHIPPSFRQPSASALALFLSFLRSPFRISRSYSSSHLPASSAVPELSSPAGRIHPSVQFRTAIDTTTNSVGRYTYHGAETAVTNTEHELFIGTCPRHILVHRNVHPGRKLVYYLQIDLQESTFEREKTMVYTPSRSFRDNIRLERASRWNDRVFC